MVRSEKEPWKGVDAQEPRRVPGVEGVWQGAGIVSIVLRSWGKSMCMLRVWSGRVMVGD